ncbi:MAG: DUF2868 domain-containing protein [Burkholderiales bacterium]|nr:DUF2868 domain-containing protein [Burkholderiales bacterium]
MNESEARDALLVRAYETAQPLPMTGHWAEDDRAWATQAALQSVGEQAGADTFIACRAQLACERLCSQDSGAKQVLSALTWRPWIGWVLALVAFIAGIITDAIGPAKQINVLAPPLLAVLAWNLAVYLVLVVRAITRLSGAGSDQPGPLARLITHAIAPARRIERLTPPLACFARDWIAASAPLTAARIARILHTAAAAFAGGALLGMYVRGFALEYRAVWESTFLDASTVHAILSVVLGPASAVTAIALPDAAGLAAIRSAVSPGENAAHWIHLYAMTVALFVLMPRVLLALGRFFVERRLASPFPLAMDDGYFQALARAHRGEAAVIRIVPYSYHPGPQAALGLNALMVRVFGSRTEVTITPPVAFGEEDALDSALIPGAKVALVSALFSLTATPEQENHGAFIDTLAARVPQSVPFAVLIDESAFRQRFGEPGGTVRLQERRATWQRMLTGNRLEPVFVDLEHHDFTFAERALRAALAQAAARAAQS